jgi:guanine nucleotide-binding protein G(i) subunit alpha
MLLLGAGESGKSTILKQMKLIHQGSYSDKERETYKEIIYSNTVQSMHVILDAMDLMGIALSTASLDPYHEIVMQQPHQIEADYLDPQVTQAIALLWEDSGVQECFRKSREYQLNDSAQ